MTKKIRNISIVLIMVIAVVLYIIFSNRNKSTFVQLPQSNYSEIIVNDQNVASAQTTETDDIPGSFNLVAENEQLELYLEEETVAIVVRDKVNDYTWSSYDIRLDLDDAGYSQEMLNYMRSGISIINYEGFTPGRRTLLDSAVELDYQEVSNGFNVTIDFTRQQIKFDVSVTLQGGDLLVHVPIESIEEYNPNLWRPGSNNISLSQIIVFPFLGGTESEENGYAVIPDGPGAIVHLDDVPRSTSGYTASVYGRDIGYENNPSPRRFSGKPLEHVSLPIYGLIHDEGQAGILAISESGESYATYNYRPKGTNTSYYQSYFSYNYRTAYSQFQSRVNEDQHVLGFQETPNGFDLVQRYVFLRDEDAHYVGVAKTYRDFLEKKSGLSELEQRMESDVPMKIDFLNNEVKQGALGIEDVILAEYTQAIDVVKQLKERGYHQLNVTFKSFVREDWIYGVDVFRNLGGKNELEEALSYFEENTIDFNFYSDYTRSYHDKTSYVANKMNRNDFIVFNSENETMNYMNKPEYYQTLAEQHISVLESLNINSLALDGLGTNLFTHFNEDIFETSTEGMAHTEALLEYIHGQEIKTSMYAPNAYLYSYLDAHFDTPIYSSGLSFASETIPLLQLVLSGKVEMYSPYLNISSNDQDTILNLIEYGVFPAFLLTAESAYNLKETATNNISVSELHYLEDRMDLYYSQVNMALSEVMGSEMIGHEMIDQGVVEVTYSNGKRILVNYNNSNYSHEGIEIGGKGFVIR